MNYGENSQEEGTLYFVSKDETIDAVAIGDIIRNFNHDNLSARSGLLYGEQHNIFFTVKDGGFFSFKGTCYKVVIDITKGCIELDFQKLKCEVMYCKHVKGCSSILIGDVNKVVIEDDNDLDRIKIITDERVLQVASTSSITNLPTVL